MNAVMAVVVLYDTPSMIPRARSRSLVFLNILKEHETSINAGVSASAHLYDHPPIKPK